MVKYEMYESNKIARLIHDTGRQSTYKIGRCSKAAEEQTRLCSWSLKGKSPSDRARQLSSYISQRERGRGHQLVV
eukprot:2518577-Pyramimonas_sp.AAC.1